MKSFNILLLFISFMLIKNSIAQNGKSPFRYYKIRAERCSREICRYTRFQNVLRNIWQRRTAADLSTATVVRLITFCIKFLISQKIIK